MKRKISFFLVLALILAIPLGTAAYAATGSPTDLSGGVKSEVDTAASYLVQHGIYKGDEKGNLNLDKTLTRAELAVILTRLDFAASPGGLADWDSWGEKYFSDPENRYNKFTDVPAWAMPYVEYCYQRGLMLGTAATLFGSQGTVNPKMACTVILRYCGFAETDWNYDTSVEKARKTGLAPSEGTDGNEILRGTMAVILYRGINYAESGTVPGGTPETTPAPTPVPTPSPQVTMTIDEMKAEIVRLTNVERVKAGLPELKVLPELMNCAQAKAQDFIDNHYYGHTSPVYGSSVDMIFSFIPQAVSCAENIAPWTRTPAEAFAGWVESKAHYDHIISVKYTHIGVGIVEGADGGYWWVQQFVKL